MIDLHLPPEIETRLNALARLTGRSTSFFAQEAILEHLDDLEDIYLAEQRLEDLRAGNTGTIPLAELMTRYGVED